MASGSIKKMGIDALDISSYFTNYVDGSCEIKKYGRIGIILFNDLKLSATNSTTISSAVPEIYRPSGSAINIIGIFKGSDTTNYAFERVWLRPAGTFGLSVSSEQRILNGQIIYITAS